MVLELRLSENLGGNAVYRVSKAALNQFTKGAAMDFKNMGINIKALAVNPGYVPTRMTGFVGDDDLDECMKDLVTLIEGFETEGGSTGLMNGGFVDRKGRAIRY